jgi:hypothetical protein
MTSGLTVTAPILKWKEEPNKNGRVYICSTDLAFEDRLHKAVFMCAIELEKNIQNERWGAYPNYFLGTYHVKDE